MNKGINTKETILKAAFDLTSKFGLEALSIGELSKIVGMSKSGLFGHFKSKEKLQIMVLDFAAQNFTHQVVIPALKSPRGTQRIMAIMNNWMNWSSSYLAGGCPFLSAIVEFDDRPGKVRDHVQVLQEEMIATFEKAVQIAVDEKQLAPSVSVKQLTFEIYSKMIGFHIYNRLLKEENAKEYFLTGIESILDKPTV